MKKLLLLCLVLISPITNAGWTNTYGEVTELMSHDGLHVLYTTIDESICGATGNFWWSTSDPDSKDMYAMALAALMSGKQVRIVYDKTTPNCMFGHAAEATHMRMVR